MTRSCLRSALLCGALSVLWPEPARAQASPQTSAEDKREAQEHFQRAKEQYQQGRYNEAIQELEAARGLDPHAKDLVFNLGIVHEKLGQFDDAIADFRAYLEMEDVTPEERSKAESIIKRIEGARREVHATPTPSERDDKAGDGNDGTPERPEQPVPEQPSRGRIDPATIAAGSVAIVGLGVGTIFGIRALALRPTDFVTGRDGTYADFQSRNDDAHTSAVVADIGFGVGIVAALATAWLYFGRPKQSPRTGLFVGPGTLAGSFR